MRKPRTLHYAGQPGEGFGWGICNKNLRDAMSRRFKLVDGNADVCFMPLADHDFNPASDARGRVNVAYTFFEYALGPKAAENAGKYDVVFVGSTWCQERLRDIGIESKVLIQGVDQTIFSRQSPRAPDGQFRIFSGGKFEWRKGQDLVIAAFREFAREHTEAHLVCSWHNLWFNQLAGSMLQSPHITMDRVMGNTQEEFFRNLLNANGLDYSQGTVLPQLSQKALAAEMANTDIGLFPNRCEGGTNLVLMEYLSCGRPAVANLLTGHADLRGAAINEIPAIEDVNHWATQSVPEIVETIHDGYSRPNLVPCPSWSWERSAQTIVDSLK
jgi:glycosyltransferase involved in cell wall biosynthesis